jgi:hypothetical protein
MSILNNLTNLITSRQEIEIPEQLKQKIIKTFQEQNISSIELKSQVETFNSNAGNLGKDKVFSINVEQEDKEKTIYEERIMLAHVENRNILLNMEPSNVRISFDGKKLYATADNDSTDFRQEFSLLSNLCNIPSGSSLEKEAEINMGNFHRLEMALLNAKELRNQSNPLSRSEKVTP